MPYMIVESLEMSDDPPLYHDCSIFGDRGYIGAEIQLDLFETANI